jgi:orotate phosphoribosyltransferase
MKMDEWEELRKLIVERGVKLDLGFNSDGTPAHWLVDCREVLLVPRGAYLISKLMYEKFKTFKSRNVGGLTIAANPLVSYLVLLAYQDNRPASGFIIRKEPKYNGLRKLIEGDFKLGESVVIVDDLINSGGSVFRAIKNTEENGCSVEGVITIVNFENNGLKELKEKGYRVEYLFDLKDLYIKNKVEDENIVKPRLKWSIKNLNQAKIIVPHSSPIQYKNTIMFGTNEGRFLCADKNTGKIKWSINIEVKNPKGILSSPAIKDGFVFFGAYSGFLYCANADNGKIKWKTRTGEWIGSSPCISDDKVFVGIEYGLRGGSLCAYSVKSGKLLWNLRTKHYIHSSPAVDEKMNIAIIGCNDGHVYAVNSKDGKLIWKHNIGKETKAGFAIDKETGYVYFGSFDGNIYCFKITNGKLIWKKRVGSSVYNTPEIVGDNLICSTVSSRIFSLNKKDGSINWYYNTGTEIFSHTNTIENKIYCGSNDGFLYVIDLKTGLLIKKYEVGKIIVTKPLIDNDKMYLGCKGEFLCFDL